MGIRTDLALESEFLEDGKLDGVVCYSEEIKGVNLTKIKIETDRGAKSLKRPIGLYITLEYSAALMLENFEIVETILINQLNNFFENKKSVLVVGLGNRNISPDALGPISAEKIAATRHIEKNLTKELGFSNLRSVVVLAPGVLGQTGLEATELIKLVSKNIELDLIVAIDALAAKDLGRLGTTIQLTNVGIVPGSGVENRRLELSEKTLNLPVLAVGVPTVVDLQTAFEDLFDKRTVDCAETMIITARDVDRMIYRNATIISSAINRVLYPNLSKKELEILTC